MLVFYDSFTDAQGHVYLDGREEPRLRVVGWAHVVGCPHFETVELGRLMCDCDGKAVLGWAGHWPLPPLEPSRSIVIDCSGPHEETG